MHTRTHGRGSQREWKLERRYAIPVCLHREVCAVHVMHAYETTPVRWAADDGRAWPRLAHFNTLLSTAVGARTHWRTETDV